MGFHRNLRVSNPSVKAPSDRDQAGRGVEFLSAVHLLFFAMSETALFWRQSRFEFGSRIPYWYPVCNGAGKSCRAAEKLDAASFRSLRRCSYLEAHGLGFRV